MPAMEGSDTHDLARDLRVQEFGKTRPTAIADALVEPAGPVCASSRTIGDGRAIIWFDGEQIDEHAEVAAALARAAARPCHKARSSRPT